MNLRHVSRLLGIICLLIGGFMIFSMPWAHPALGSRNVAFTDLAGQFEMRGFVGLLVSCLVCLAIGGVLWWLGRGTHGPLYRRESMAVVGLSWVLATALGGLPFYFAHVARGPTVQLGTIGDPPLLLRGGWSPWRIKPRLPSDQDRLLRFVLDGGAAGRSSAELRQWVGSTPDSNASASPEQLIRDLMQQDADWRSVWLLPGEPAEQGSNDHYRIRFARMTLVDAMFESQSGFSTTGATTIAQLENPHLVPHCILFWRSSTHFLGGLGIIVLFVVILGHGSVGKTLMRTELPGPTQDSSQTRMQHAAWAFAATYVVLNLLLIGLMRLFGMSWFDAICHAFGTMATGGFSTYNASLGHFESAWLEFIVVLFMILAGTNFTLLIVSLRGRPLSLLRDVEWQTYMVIILVATVLVVAFGCLAGDFAPTAGDVDEPAVSDWSTQLLPAIRYGLFQVVSIMTTTGYGTHDFDRWNDFGRAVLIVLMFIGGCAGSTGGGLKVMRIVLLSKVLRLEMEQAFRPSVVRPLRLAGRPVDDPLLHKNILLYFVLIGVIFVLSWLVVVMVEPMTTWTGHPDNKLIDSASIVAATLNNIGPGLGTVGATRNYGHLTPVVKLLCTWLMMLGRVEVMVILCLFIPRFWRST